MQSLILQRYPNVAIYFYRYIMYYFLKIIYRKHHFRLILQSRMDKVKIIFEDWEKLMSRLFFNQKLKIEGFCLF